MSHFRTQVEAENGITSSIVSKALPITATNLTKLLNASLAKEIFRLVWKKARIIALNKTSVLLSTRREKLGNISAKLIAELFPSFSFRERPSPAFSREYILYYTV